MLSGVGDPDMRVTLAGMASAIEVAAVVVRVADDDLVGARGETAVEGGKEVRQHGRGERAGTAGAGSPISHSWRTPETPSRSTAMKTFT